MYKNFLQTLEQNRTNKLSSKSSSCLEQIQSWTSQLYDIMFIDVQKSKEDSFESLFKNSQNKMVGIVQLCYYQSGNTQNGNNYGKVCKQFYETSLPQTYQLFLNDLQSKFKTHQKQPSQYSSTQLKKIYPQFTYIFLHRISHQLYKINLPKISNIITNQILRKYRIYIDEKANIGGGFVICSGVNIQIGGSCVIGRNVRVYDQVVLGEIGGSAGQKEARGCPVIEDDVVLYSGVTVLGGRTIVGHGSVIGTRVFLTESVLPNSKIFNNPQNSITPINIKDKFTIHGLIGNTPLIQIKNIFKHPKVKIYAKLQGQNPGGSVKDRPAYNMIKQALRRGEIGPGMKLIQPTSGNTGIALAMIACVFNLDIQLVMPENSTAERVQTMEAYGAKVVLTPAATGIEGSRDYAQAQVAKGGYKMLNQFGNHDNYMAHYHSTGPQIWRDTNGQVTHFVSSMGTTGTIMGTSMFLKQKNKDIQIVGVQPKQGAKIPGIRRWTPQYLPTIYKDERVDKKIDVSQQESLIMMRRMAKQQAIFAGMSSGGAMAAAIRLAETLTQGVIVSIVCDRGDRYLSSGIFASQN